LKYKLSSKDALRLTILIIAFLAVFVSFSDNSTAATINVGSGAGNQSATIQGAVDIAGNNDIINVHRNGSGTYNESVSITKSNLTLQAANGEDVQVSTPQELGKPIFYIKGTFPVQVEFVTLKGFNIISHPNLFYSLVKLENANFCNVTNNTLTNLNQFTAGVEVLYITNNNTISNNIITGGSYGIYKNGANPSNGNKYLNNHISNSKTGITITGASNTTISNNIITLPDIGGATGIFLGIDAVANQLNVINNNSVTKAVNPATSSTGIYVSGGGSSITDNQIYSNDVTNLQQGFYIGVGTTSNWTNAIFLNRIYNNTYGLKILSIGTLSSVNATNNWWGKNTAPTVFIGSTTPASTDIWRLFTGGTTDGVFSYDPWLVLNISANPSSIIAGDNSIITADLTKNSNNEDTTTIYPGKYVPDGITANFSSDALGSVNPSTNTTTNGKSNTTFTGNTPGVSTVSAIVDAQTVTTDVTINNPPIIPTAVVVDPVSGFKGDVVDLTATLTDTLNNVPLAGKSVQFSVNGNIVGTATTNAQGIATFAYTITQNIGTYNILAEFLGDLTYEASSNTNDLTVNPTATAIVVNPATGFNGHVVNLVATLTDTLNNVPLAGKSVQFSVNGNIVGTAVTNAQGIATFAYTVTQNIGTYTILAQFFQDTVYAASSNTNNLRVVTYSPPVVTSSDPVFNGMNVAVNKVIKVYFNEAVKFGTNPWIELLTSTGTPVPFTRTISGGNVLSIASTSLFASNTMYRVILHSNSITDLDGAGLAGPWSTIFTTSPAPTVTSSNPTYNAMNVAVDKVIKVYFSQSVKFGTNPWIEFTTSTGTPIPFTRTISGGNVLSIKTTPLMATNTTYRITLHTNSITNLAGAGIALWSTKFTTTT
jgi:parallel beta-helix repeat protein